jgi:hypothetical protein
MALQKSNLKKDDVSIEIDTESLLGSSAKDASVKETFFQLAFDKMLERLDNGIGADGKKLGKYSTAYMNSLEFAAFGKDKTVNMQLTGGMVNSLQILKSTNTKMKVGFEGEESVKAYAHMTGYQGHPTLDGKVAPRKFFGWTDSELKAIAREFRTETKSNDLVKDEVILRLIDRLVG